MAGPREETRELLDEKPELAEDLRAIMEVDAAEESWTFHDVPVDSGAFGTIVSRGLVEKRDGDSYEVTDRKAISAVLEGDERPDDSPRELDVTSLLRSRISLSDLDARVVATVATVLGIVAGFRMLPFPDVFRNGRVVLSSNDPYYYWHHVDRLLREAEGPFDLAVLSTLPPGIAEGEPLFVAVIWWVVELLGGGVRTAGVVLALYPVVAAVGSSILLYVLAVRLTDDVRVGLASVGFLAVTPVHAVRTGVGFADHHAIDYLLLAATATFLALVSEEETDSPRGWAVAAALGVSIAAQTLAWEAAPLLLTPVGFYIAVRVLIDVDRGESPLEHHQLLLAGLGLGGGLTYLVHAALEWHTTVVASAPLLLLAGAVSVVGLAEGVHRYDGGVRMLGIMELIGGVGATLVLPAVSPKLGEAVDRGLQTLFRTGGISETRSLFTRSLGGLFAPNFQFGFVIVLAIPYMGWLAWRVYRGLSSAWLVPLTYGAVLTVLSVLQIRFAAHLALFVALFSGVAFIDLAVWTEVTDEPSGVRDSRNGTGTGTRTGKQLELPERRSLLRWTGLTLGVGGFGGLLTVIEHEQVDIDQGRFGAAVAMEEHADRNEWVYPRNYVFSNWTYNRFYNWIVNNTSRSYSFAKAHYEQLLSQSNESALYKALTSKVQAKTGGFVVTSDDDILARTSEDSLYSRLHEEAGSGTSHFRLIHVGEGGTPKGFTCVAGATITGHTDLDTVTVTRQFDVSGRSFEYSLTVSPTDGGWYAARVPHAGTYTVADGERRTISVADETVLSGGFTAEPGKDGNWPFSAGRGKVLFDVSGDHHGRIHGAGWVRDARETGLRFSRGDIVMIPRADTIRVTDGFDLRVRFKLDEDVDYETELNAPRIIDATFGSNFRNTHGLVVGLDNRRLVGAIGGEKGTAKLSIPDVPKGRWIDARLRWTGERLALEIGNQIQQAQYSGDLKLNSTTYFGGQSPNTHLFQGRIASVEIRTDPN